MFPVLAQTAVRAPEISACVIAAVMPVSLNEPVGLQPWCFSRRSDRPQYFAESGAWKSGVLPSNSVTNGAVSPNGSTSR